MSFKFVEPVQDHLAAKRGVLGQEDFAHGAGTDGSLDLVLGETVTPLNPEAKGCRCIPPD